MSTIYEGGHAKNLASLKKITQLGTDIGAAYSPVPTDITVAGLNTLYTNSDAALTAVKNTYNDWKNAINARKIAFFPIKQFCTQLLGILQSSGANQQTVDNYTSLLVKVRGIKLSKPDEPNANKAIVNDPPPVELPITHSASQVSFDNMIEHFDKMIKLLASVPSYNPSEAQFKIINLNAQLAALKTLNFAGNDTWIKLTLARINRNKFFYADVTGMLDIARKVKNYIKGKFGAASQEYKKAAAIKFVRVVAKKKAK